MFDIKSFYEAKDVKDAVEALVREPEAEVISGGTDVLIRVREGKDAGIDNSEKERVKRLLSGVVSITAFLSSTS